MIKQNNDAAKHPQTHNISIRPPVYPIRLINTEPLRIPNQKREKKGAAGIKSRESHQIRIEIVEQEKVPKGKGHKKGKSMDIEMIAQYSSRQLPGAQPSRKIVIDSNFIHEMRKRSANSEMNSNLIHEMRKRSANSEMNSNLIHEMRKRSANSEMNSNLIQQMRKRSANSEMKHYPHPPKKKRPSEGGNKSERLVIEINSCHTAPSHPKKNRQISHSHTLSTKLNQKADLHERRCKSSLTNKKSKPQHELKMMEQSLPLPSKLNSLYSNTTSIYNSHNDLALIDKKLSLRIPTEQSQQMEEIRRYESLVLSREKSIKAIRNARQPVLGMAMGQPLVEPECLKTEDIISSYILKFEAQPQPVVVHPATLEHINELCRETKAEIKGQSQGSIIQRLDSVSIEEHLSENEAECSIAQELRDKQQMLKTIKEILQKKKMKEQKGEKILEISKGEKILEISEYSAKQPKTKGQLDSSSINNDSLTSSIVSEKDISVLNLQILDKALRQRQKHIQSRLIKQLQRMEQEGESEEQAERVKKWLQHQMKQVRQSRMQLWKGISVANNLLKQDFCDKNREMMRCLSEKYIHKSSQSQMVNEKWKNEKRQKKQNQSPSDKLINQEGQNLNDAMWQQQTHKLSQKSLSPIVLSSFIQQNPLNMQDLRFFTSKDSYHSPPLQTPTKHQNILQLVRPYFQSSQKQLKRQRLNCESPHSDSQSESYGALIFQREDTFLFSSQKKEESSFGELSPEDKEEICEFLFLDLCIEISDEVGREGRVMNTLRKFVQKMREYSRRQKGFKTNSSSMKDYLCSFIAFLKGRPQLLQEIHDAMDKPMGPTTIEILRYMHSYNQEPEEDSETYVLTAKTFDAFEDFYMRGVKLERYYDDDERQNRRKFFIINAIHIHNKAIYDAFNETLDKDRPFGIWGEPFSWKKVPKFYRPRDTKTKNQMLMRRAQQTIELSHFLCGFMADKEDCPLKDNPNVTDSYLQQIRHDRLSQMIAKELQESEQRMRFFDDEETQLLVDTAHSIFSTLVQEVALLL